MVSVFIDSKINQFFQNHKQDFEDKLLNQAVSVRDKINDILRVGDIDLINNAHRLVYYVINGHEEELEAFAKQEGIAWATHSLTLSFKLEWVQAIRRTLWFYIKEYCEETNICSLDSFFELEEEVNNHIDKFLNAFFINYSTYKDSLLTAQRQLVENLSVPIIPITPSICILPLIGTIDSVRSTIIEEKVLMEISRLHIQTLIIDLSGIADMENEVIDHLLRVINGTSLMGCTTVITGLRSQVVRKIVRLGISFGSATETFGTLQQALRKHLKNYSIIPSTLVETNETI